ncbi:MAG: gliding motility-associated C-terminal domain-containing protein [Bacteroidota bacterium]
MNPYALFSTTLLLFYSWLPNLPLFEPAALATKRVISPAEVFVDCTSPSVDLGPDTSICRGAYLQLRTAFPTDCQPFDWRWSDTTHFLSPAGLQAWLSPPEDTVLVLDLRFRSGENLVVNGDFSQGNAHFTSELEYRPSPTLQTPLCLGCYTVGVDPTANADYWLPCKDHSSGTDFSLFMADASEGLAEEYFWCQTISVSPHTDYELSAWATMLLDEGVSKLQFYLDRRAHAVPQTLTSNCNWTGVQTEWNSGSQLEVELCIVNIEGQRNGDNIALDDIRMEPLIRVSDTIYIQVDSCWEICNNGIDDDGDGALDCQDEECSCTQECLDQYYVDCDTTCIASIGDTSLALTPQWTSSAIVGNFSQLVAGDLDRDGIPEVVTYRIGGQDLLIIDGKTGETERRIPTATTFEGGSSLALGDVDGDAWGEIIAIGEDGHLLAYEFDGTLKYRSPQAVGYRRQDRLSGISLADFDYNGTVEINVGTQIYEGATGALLVEGTDALSRGRSLDGENYATGFVVAIDALPDYHCPSCAGLEIVAGNQVLAVDLVTGDFSVAAQAAAPLGDGFTSTADFDGDGDLDGIVMSSENDRWLCYVWDLQTPEIIRGPYLSNASSADGPTAGRPVVADLTGDGQLELAFSTTSSLVILDNNLSGPLDPFTLDDPSHSIGVVAFDFFRDGAAELVYRDVNALHIFDFLNNQHAEFDCHSGTFTEYPLILDVDADGQTEILTTCGPSNEDGQVLAFESAATPWAVTRPVWNQPHFFNLHVSDDLSIPPHQGNPAALAHLPFNNFLQAYSQSKSFAADAELRIDRASCRGDSAQLDLVVCNRGRNVLSFQTPIAIYWGDPTNRFNTAPLVGKFNLSKTLAQDSCIRFPVTVPWDGMAKFFAVVNDDHSIGTPYLFERHFPLTNIAECDYSNNLDSFSILPFELSGTVSISCYNQSNGAIRVSPLAGQAPFVYTWSTHAQDTNWLTGLAPGNYGLLVTDALGCNTSEVFEVTEGFPIHWSIQTQPASCAGGADAEVEVEARGGTPLQYFWGNGTEEPNMIGLKAGVYYLTMEDEAGCRVSDSVTVGEPAPLFINYRTERVTCPDRLDGAIHFEALGGGVPPYLLSRDTSWYETVDQLPLVMNDLFPGQFPIALRDANGCVLWDTVEVGLVNAFGLELGENLVINLGEEVGVGVEYWGQISSVSWYPAHSVDCSDCEYPRLQPTSTTTYITTVSDSLGCSYADSLTVRVSKDHDYFAPNVFSPNGDQVNDRFTIYGGAAIRSIRRLQVFDRWGGTLFWASNLQPGVETQGWDGTFRGRPMEVGVYVYQVEIEFWDGKIQLDVGDLLLVR